MIIRFFKRLINGFRWFVFGFNDYDWDHGYFINLLLYKLRRMKKCLCKDMTREDAENENNKPYVDSLRKLRKVIIWLKQLIDDKPFSIVSKFMDKYPLKMKTDKNGYLQIKKINKKVSKEYQDKLFTRVNIIYEKETKKLINKIFDTIRDYHQCWWN